MNWKVFNHTNTEQTLTCKKVSVVFPRKDNIFKGDANVFKIITDEEKKFLQDSKESHFQDLLDSGDFSIIEIKGGKKNLDSENKKESYEKTLVV